MARISITSSAAVALLCYCYTGLVLAASAFTTLTTTTTTTTTARPPRFLQKQWFLSQQQQQQQRRQPQSQPQQRHVGGSIPTATTTARSMVASVRRQPGTAVLDQPWETLGFEFRPTRSHGRIVYRNGEWGELELVEDPFIQLHIGATALHYGQACFEGLKAFCHADQESVYLFRPEANAQRMQASCQRIFMPPLPTDRFVDACRQVVQDNIDYVPPYGTNGALYIRPLLFGSGPRIGLQPADEYTFLLMVIPVGDYYAKSSNSGSASSSSGLKPVQGIVLDDYDRAAPRGVGHVKVAGNYAADLWPNYQAKQQGFPIALYLDAATHTYVEEFSTSNLVAIDNLAKRYVTPSSPSILPSITNKSLQTLAKDILGYTVEERNLAWEELSQFQEVFAVGTAVVATPVASLTRFPPPPPSSSNNNDKDNDASSSSSSSSSSPQPQHYQFGSMDQVGETTLKLYQLVRDVQCGHLPDKYGWLVKV